MSTFTKEILKFLAHRIIKKYRPGIIGVAGGKEEIKETKKMISRVLASQFSVKESENLFNNETNFLLAIIGADSVKTMKVFIKALKIILTEQKYPEFLVLEMKASQAGEIKSLFRIARPEAGIIIGAEESSSSKQSIREKNLLIKHLRKNELAILNCDNKATKNFIEGVRAKVITFGFDEKADIRATEVISENDNILESANGEKRKNGEKKINFKINYQNTFIPIRLTRRQIYPALAAAVIGLNYGLNLVEISEALSNQE